MEYKSLDKDNVFETIDYDRLMYFIDNFGTGLFLIGGPWDKSTEAVAPMLNELAKSCHLTVYNYDPKFIDVFGEENDLRDCKSLEIKLKYYAIVEKLGFKSKELVKDTLIPKIHTPFIFGLKNGSCVGYYTAEFNKNHNKLVDQEGNDKTYELAYNIGIIIAAMKVDKAKYEL